MSQGKKNRRKGHAAEQEYAKIFRNLGFKHCKTSRHGSRLHDDAGIDLIFIPYNVQIKAGYKRGLNYSKELKYLEDKMNELFPETSEEHQRPKVLIHKKDVGRGRKRTEYDDLIIMTFKDFEKIILQESILE